MLKRNMASSIIQKTQGVHKVFSGAAENNSGSLKGYLEDIDQGIPGLRGQRHLLASAVKHTVGWSP